MTTRSIYRFGADCTEGHADWKALLGGKGANLAEMARIGIPVPPGFTITTEACVSYMQSGRMPAGLMDEVRDHMAWLEQVTGRTFGCGAPPLLVSVRSGARASMPGMMDTVLNLGLSAEGLEVLAEGVGSRRFALDTFRRLIGMFGDVVLGIPAEAFDAALDAARARHAGGGRNGEGLDREQLLRRFPDHRLTEADLSGVVDRFLAIVREHSGSDFPSDPYAQLQAAIEAVFRSWRNPRARVYREMHGIPDSWGTAVNIQAMVYGNLGADSATGVAFTRDPSTGERRFYGEWLPDAQGEDVVAGIRTPHPLTPDGRDHGNSLAEALPAHFAELEGIRAKLEQHFRDMQDIEFTIEAGRLYLLQTRSGKRSARAAVRIAVEMVDEGLLRPDEAILRVDAGRLEELLFPGIDPTATDPVIATGLPASPGAVCGSIVLDAEDAEARAAAGEAVILVRTETSPEDLHGMKAARGIVTVRGGATSHAAVVARGMGRPCIAGCSALEIDEATATVTTHAADGVVLATLHTGDLITIDGSSGQVYAGAVATVDAGLSDEMQRLLGWCKRIGGMSVRANADTPEQVRQAVELGAQGVGLCRTEHMFFSGERIRAVREMILAADAVQRQAALDRLLPFQVEDFTGMFRALAGRPLTIRLLDPPLHEFLPADRRQCAELAADLRMPVDAVERRVAELREQNPMLGHRGVRLAVSYPEIATMQARAIFTAACRVRREGIPVHPEVMVPLVIGAGELRMMRDLVALAADAVFRHEKITVRYRFGTMIEVPRAALCAGELASEAEFFSFGTNDLTQTTLGLSRDDAGGFLSSYVARRLLPADPFRTLDADGVAPLIRMAVERGAAVRGNLIFGLCGEHGGDPTSIRLCERMGLSYVSCSPFRIPVARVAAAQAHLLRIEGDAAGNRDGRHGGWL